MLKRQRPATPPPAFLDDSPFLLVDGPSRPPHTVDPAQQPRSKRQRVQPPPLDGALRGWLESARPHDESDGEENWIDDACDVPPPLTTTDEYKDANSILRGLHVLSQHRLLFPRSLRGRRQNAAFCTYIQDARARGDASPRCPAPPQHAHDRSESRSGCVGDKSLVEEVECVRQRYEDANRLLGSLFLSRRREVERMTSSTGLDADS